MASKKHRRRVNKTFEIRPCALVLIFCAQLSFDAIYAFQTSINLFLFMNLSAMVNISERLVRRSKLFYHL